MQPCAVQYNCLQIEIDHVLASFALETNGSKFEGASCLKNNLYFSMTFTIMELTCATIYIHAWISVGLKRENSSIKIHKRNCSMVCMASTGSKSLTITQFNPASDFPSDEKAFMGWVHGPGPGLALLELLWYGAFTDRKPWAVQEVMLKHIGKQVPEGRRPPKQHGLVQIVWDLARSSLIVMNGYAS